MAKKKTQFEWGARSAIQKAIRRSDGTMLKKAIETLFSREPSWVSWRMPVLSAEEVPQLLGTAGLTAKVYTAKQVGVENSMKAALEVLSTICSYKKDKTTWALTAYLYNYYYRGFKPPVDMDDLRSRQWKLGLAAFTYIQKGVPDTIWKPLLKKAEAADIYIQNIVEAGYNRFQAGGMEFDKILMATTAIVALTEYDDQSVVRQQDALVDLDGSWEGDWPWYVYDMHTLPGKKALAYAAKKYGVPKDILGDIWFIYDSNHVERGDILSGYWYPVYLKEFERNHDVNKEQWLESPCREDIKKLVARFVAEEN